ncbi:alpha/beta fold hydrolase [Tranquillimonas rosea]|uniref:alpha/beta fold hydrolase n=1 Tax=Tranquillimonas rosea TaxID=641238 RepID=UPI003BA94D01
MTTDRTNDPKPCAWEVDGLRLAGLAWGPEDGTPVLALHGWMDHAESFRELAPRLAGCRVVALDLSGQGLSAHRAAHATYNIWDDLPQLAGVMDRLGWDDCVLLGHSRGANIAALFGAAQPDRVRALVALESLVPEPVASGSFVSTLRAFVEQTRKQQARPPRTFASREEYVARRVAQGNSRATSEALADRALKQGPGGVTMRGDPRLFASSAVKLTQADIESVLRGIGCPVLNVWGTDGLRQRRPKVAEMIGLAETLIADYAQIELAGDHHFHLDPAVAAQIAQATMSFLDQRPSGDCGGG